MEFDTKSSEPSGHKDAKENILYYQKTIYELELAPDVTIEIGYHVQEPTCSFVVWGEIGRRKGSFVITFHQDRLKFTQESSQLFYKLKNLRLAR